MNNPRQNLQGKVAIVTGASKGIGEAIAHLFAKAGARVVVSSRKQDAVDDVAAQFKEKGLEATGIACHMGDSTQIDALVSKTEEIYGGIDIIVNNAVTNPIYGPIVEADLKAYDKIMEVNVKGPFYFSQLVYPIMRERGGGSILNISSVAGLTPDQGLGVYSMSKSALNMMTKVMAKEWGPDNIRVNAICPGVIRTKFAETFTKNEAIMDNLMESQPLKYIGEPDDVAQTALLLASDAGSYFTGAVITVDGGFSV